MNTPFRRRWITGTAVAVVGLGFGAGLLWLLTNESRPSQVMLCINYAGPTSPDEPRPGDARHEKVVPDFLRRKFEPRRRVDFEVTCSQDTSVFVMATGVQVLTPTGWKVAAEEHRGEIWRLKTGIAQEVCVERQPFETWRAYVRYGTEMKGPSLLKAELREARKNRSFSNWGGKAWGGGRWSGAHELFSEEIEE